MATVLVTGSTGFIAKHVVRRLLDAGHTVVGSTRRPDGAAEVADAVRPHLDHPDRADTHLRSVLLDLDRDEGWDEALSDVDVLVHTASPFPLSQPKDPDELIRPAVAGTERALRAAARNDVRRVVLTSSVVAVEYTDLPPGRATYDERDWTDPDPDTTSVYTRSKTLAERRAWELADELGLDLTTINPGFVQGAPLDDRVGTSMRTVQRLLQGKDPALPKVAFSIVHVDDVARAHVRAVEIDEAVGQRFVVAGRERTFAETARLLKDAYPDRRITTREAPNLVVRALALVDSSIATIRHDLGRSRPFDASRSADVLGVDPVGREDEALLEAAAHLVDNGLV